MSMPPVLIYPDRTPEFVKERNEQEARRKPFNVINGSQRKEIDDAISPEGWYTKVAELKKDHPPLPPFCA